MEESFVKIRQGYEAFRKKYALGDNPIMQALSNRGQKPRIMVISCCDSRVDPAVILQCDPGDLFVVRNVANIVPPCEKDGTCHGTSAALEFGICYLNVRHLILLGHSQCGGIQHLLTEGATGQDDFLSRWVSQVRAACHSAPDDTDACAKSALDQSRENCLTFPWIQDRVNSGALTIHLWFFDISRGEILTHSQAQEAYHPL